jgi:hypothetical protein
MLSMVEAQCVDSMSIVSVDSGAGRLAGGRGEGVVGQAVSENGCGRLTAWEVSTNGGVRHKCESLVGGFRRRSTDNWGESGVHKYTLIQRSRD